MHQSLVISLIATQKTELISDITAACSENNCNILETRMSTMGNECALIMHITGNWSCIAKLETQLQRLGKKGETLLQIKRTENKKYETKLMPYLVHVTTVDAAGIAASVTSFFTDQNIAIYNLSTNRYQTEQTQTAMQSLSLTALLPTSTHLADFRESFIMFCDEYNLDAIFEPDRN